MTPSTLLNIPVKYKDCAIKRFQRAKCTPPNFDSSKHQTLQTNCQSLRKASTNLPKINVFLQNYSYRNMIQEKNSLLKYDDIHFSSGNHNAMVSLLLLKQFTKLHIFCNCTRRRSKQKKSKKPCTEMKRTIK